MKSVATKIRPLGDRVLVKRVKNQEEKQGGIYIPDSAQEKPQQAQVIALGTGRRDEKGNREAFSVKVGDIVLMSKYGGTEVKLEGEEYVLVREDDILGVME